MDVRETVEKILKREAEVEGIKNCDITPNLEALNGDGFLSEFYTGTIQNKDTGKIENIYIKVTPPRKFEIVEPAFRNEVNFYSKVFPELDRFQKERGVKDPFGNIPKYFCGSLDKHHEHLAFVNLKAENYVLFDKSQFMDEKHLKVLFDIYGKFHALSFAFKAQNFEKYNELIKPVQNIFAVFSTTESLNKRMQENFKSALDYINENSKHNVGKIQPLVDDFDNYKSRGFNYTGKYAAWTHGDCWSNNLMFKYCANGELENIKLVDHQLGRDSTPVHDLSYLFYSGASKTEFDKLDYYLDLYYQSFSKFARELGADPNELLPLEALKSDWKTYGFLGVYLAVMVWEIKFMPKTLIQEEAAKLDQSEDPLEQLVELGKKGRSHPSFKRNISDILIHAAEYGII
ncbi:uncharacterized protein LOC125505871 [Dendroctonus ponderosae]|uniref:uncharacterized protein LOC125505871 n=1 Tax=Dendroctonus ponderosae TaxID=77166 RepID=UPI00203560EB|nr:uncharacterized protein LOC125505871 [Dendroctonus ponderosae]